MTTITIDKVLVDKLIDLTDDFSQLVSLTLERDGICYNNDEPEEYSDRFKAITKEIKGSHRLTR